MTDQHYGIAANYYPTDCVLCDFAGETHEGYEQHMEDAHEL